MTPPQAMPPSDTRPEARYWARADTAQAYAAFADPSCPPCSKRQYAQQQGIPRSTLGRWLRRAFPAHLATDAPVRLGTITRSVRILYCVPNPPLSVDLSEILVFTRVVQGGSFTAASSSSRSASAPACFSARLGS